MPNINEGNNGFHLYTVVTDGYGNLIAEDGKGRELARVSTERLSLLNVDDAVTPEPFIELSRLVFAFLEGETEPEAQPVDAPKEPVDGPDARALVTVTSALRAAGLHVFHLGEGILNVHSAPVKDEGDEETYLYTVTVSITP